MIKTRLIRLLSGAGKYIAANVFVQWISLLSQIAAVFMIANLLQSAFDGTFLFSDIYGYVPVMLAVIAVRFLCDRLNARTSGLASAGVKRILRGKIYDKLLRLGVSYRENVHSAEVAQLATEGVEQLETYFGKYLPQFVFSLLAPLTLFAALSRVSLAAGAVLLICVPLIPVSIVIIQRIASRLLGKYWGMYAELSDSFLENLHGLTTLKIYRADGERAEKMDEEAEKFRRITMKVLTMQLNSTSVMDILAYGGAAVGMIVALSQFLHGSLDLAGTLKVVLLAAEFFLPLRLLGSYFHIAMNGMAASDRIFELLDMEEPEKGTLPVGSFEPDIRLDNVQFSYDGYRNVLNNISLHMEGYGLYSLVGESGSGKSTAAALLAGRHSRWQGMIRISGLDLHTMREGDLMKNVLYVGSDSHLFRGTVEENLLIANAYISRQEMEVVLGRVGLLDYLRTQNGLDTQLTENASNLSGGQRQRLILARAILFDPEVLILDESTSSIDRESEDQILKVIEGISRRKIVILITHRLRNTVSSKMIYMLKDGWLREQGTHGELMASGGEYAGLYNYQMELEQYAGKENASIPQTDVFNLRTASSADSPAAPKEDTENEGLYGNAAASAGTGAGTDSSSAVSRRKRGGLQIMTRLLGLIRSLSGVIVLAAVLGVLGYLCAIFITLQAGRGILLSVFSESEPVLTGLFISMAVLAICRGVLHYAEQYCNHFIAFRLLALIRHRVFAALRRLCPAKLEGKEKGNIISILTADIELLEVFYAHTISPVLIAAAVSVFMVVYMGRSSIPAAALAVLAYLLAGVAIPLFNSRSSAEAGMEYRDAFGSLNSYILDSLYGLDETIQFGYGKKRRQTISGRSDELSDLRFRLIRMEGSQRSLTNLVILLASFGMLILTLYLFTVEAISPEGLLLCQLAMMSSFGPTAALSSLSNNLNQTLASGERVLDLLEEEPMTEDIPDFEGYESFNDDPETPAAELRGVTFAYGRDAVLQDFSAAFDRGKINGIHGSSGCGKSTALKLLMRFWEVPEGEVRIDGRNINTIPTGRLRQRQACVTQDTWLFHDTLAENIAVGRPGAGREEIVEAAKKASIHEYILSLKDGYDTPVGELGSTLSSGERQRIGLARAFLSNADMLLLDEPTASLDALNEGIILRSLKETREGKTILLVSHRRSTLNIADRICNIIN